MAIAVPLVDRLRKPKRTVAYSDDLRLVRSRLTKFALAGLLVVYLVLPGEFSDFQLSVLNRAAIFAVGALGLNLLTGYTGQVSLGHAFFMAVGAYTWAAFGAGQGMSLLLWIPIAALIGAVVGGIVGPFALRLRGNYLAIVSLGLVFVGIHVWNNWENLTGGSSGVGGPRAATIGSIDFYQLRVAGKVYTAEQGFFWLLWAVVALAVLLAKNVVRTRPGRAMQAVRDRDLAAAVIGVDLARTKVAAFALSSAYAAVCGALFGSYYGYVHPDQWSLFLSIQFIAIIIVGGVGTIFGSVIGALFITALPPLIEANASSIPLIKTITGDGAGKLSFDSLNQLIFGLVIILFLVLEPNGLAGIWFRVKSYFRAWPFSY